MTFKVAGIDAGGTSLRIRLADHKGDLALDLHGAASPDLGPESLKSLLKANKNQLAQVQVIYAGIAGISRQGMKERWHDELTKLFPDARLNLVPDYHIAFYGAVHDFGILAIAGTGSVVYGEHKQAKCRVGGRGWEWGDWGSGAWITAELLRRALNALDGLGERAKLIDAICSEMKTDDPIELCDRARQMCLSNGRGFLVPLAISSAQAGDRDAVAMIEAAADWLFKQVKAAATRLEFGRQQEFPVATVGGLWESGQLILEPFTNLLKSEYPNARVTAPLAPPIEGATRQALALLEGAAH
jgi:N-acetylglucosamine kinase-like BadF-type ATPase